MQKAEGRRKGSIAYAFLFAFCLLPSAFCLLPSAFASQSPQDLRPKTQDRSPRAQALLDQGKSDWFAMRTKSAEQSLIAATKTPATAAEAHYWLGRIYDFKGNKAEGAFPGFHEEVSYRPRAEAEFKAAGTPR